MRLLPKPVGKTATTSLPSKSSFTAVFCSSFKLKLRPFFSNSHNNSRKTNSKSLPASIAIFENVCAKLARRSIKLLKWRDVYFNQSEQGIKSKIYISLILTNHYLYAQNLSVKSGQNNSVLAGVPFLSPSRAPHALAHAQIPPSPSPFNAGHTG